MKKTNKEFIKKWVHFISPNDSIAMKHKLVTKLEECFEYVGNCNESKYLNNNIDVFLFPILAKIIKSTDINIEINIIEYVSEFKFIYDIIYGPFSTLFKNIDCEAEFGNLVAKNFIEKNNLTLK